MKRRRLGQHYLADPEVVRRVVEAARIGPEDRVLEIGTGRGALTRELTGRGASLLGYEVDPENFEATKEAVHGKGAQIRLGDAFERRPKFDVLVSSLPYSESAAFIKWLSGMEFGRAVVVLQEDFVRKINAPPGDRDYRGVSALAQIAFDVEVLERIGRRAFSPQPRVDSVVVSIAPRLRVSEGEARGITRLFSLRRRQVGSVLAELEMEGRGRYGKRRVYELSPAEVHELCRPTRTE
jgi:16S rRNA (adenine1518-N6/adenine1519-N6)-dimethyltransferase